MFIKRHRPIIIKFLGGPGAGKTTVAKALFNKLIRSSVKVNVVTSRISGNDKDIKVFATNSKFNRWCIYLGVSIINFFTIVKLFLLYIKSNKKFLKQLNKFKSFIKLHIQIQSLLFSSKSYDVLLLDRGYINGFTSLYNGPGKENFKNEIDFFNSFYSNYKKIFIYFEIDKVEGVRRSKKRSKKGDYIEELSLNDALDDYEKRLLSFHHI